MPNGSANSANVFGIPLCTLPISAFCFFVHVSALEIMYFLYNNPSENRVEFTKLKVACKYASIERGCAYL